MNILVGNNHLKRTGGTENYTFALAVELQRIGHNVEYFTFERGEVSERLEKLGIKFMSRDSYDFILANHVPVVEFLCGYGFIIQTCHGIFPSLEQPSFMADKHVCVTSEIKNYLDGLGFKSQVIYNGIDCSRFTLKKPIAPYLTCILSLSQSDELNSFIKECCDDIGVKFLSCNKFIDNLWEIEEKINQSDMVIGIGRSLYDAMACGRCVISFDKRDYMNDAIGDGYLNEENIDKSIYYNCSGRGERKTFTKQEFKEELKKYNPKDGIWAREYAIKNLNVSESVKSYLSLQDTYSEDAKDYLLMKLRRMGVIAFEKDKTISHLHVELKNIYKEKERINKKRLKYLKSIRILGYILVIFSFLLLMLLFS